jgi:ketosteroid isomerase-like protein
MKPHPLRLLLILLTLGLYTGLRADDATIIAAVRAADDERVAATIAADAKRLDAIFSSELRYAHSSGKVDTKASYTDTLVPHTTIYRTFDYVERNFRPIAPGVVLMTGRAKIQSSNGGKEAQIDLNFLAVWREENGHWRFLAWQSCKNPPPEPATAPTAPSNLKVSTNAN